jgi:adenylate kinase family enzyme
MKLRRIHITGASGAGVTTLGRASANALAIPHHDTDDYFWQPTRPPSGVACGAALPRIASRRRKAGA